MQQKSETIITQKMEMDEAQHAELRKCMPVKEAPYQHLTLELNVLMGNLPIMINRVERLDVETHSDMQLKSEMMEIAMIMMDEVQHVK